MTIDTHVEQLFGADVLGYFKNKQTGGEANQKGSRYENLFSIMQLAELFYLLADNNTDDIEIHAQALGFVDDLLILDKLHSSYRHFQLKNSVNISWGAAFKSICDDFHKQKLLNDYLGIKNTRISLVCSDLSKVETLKKNIPNSIASFSDAIFFPATGTVNQLILTHKEFKGLLEQICLSKESDKLEALAIIMLGHWESHKTTMVSVAELFSSLQRIFPNYLAKTTTIELLPEVVNIFAGIIHFDYKIEKGYFNWSYGGLDFGSLPYPVDSNDFIEFQRKVIAEHPNQFSELEGILL